MARNRQYDHEYKMQAIKLAKELGDCAKAATELGISRNTLYGWMKAVRDDMAKEFTEDTETTFDKAINDKNVVDFVAKLKDELQIEESDEDE